MTPGRRGNLDRLTDRWRARHEARRSGHRPPADSERELLARRAFPYRDVPPGDYVRDHGDDMPGFTYDDDRYSDPELDAWLLEVGRLLRERRRRRGS